MTDSTLIAAGAFLFSGISLIVSLRTRKDQAALARRQIQAHDDSAAARKKALVKATVGKRPGWSGSADLIVLTNVGLAPARNVQITFLDNNSPLQVDEAAETLPIAVLQPGSNVPILAAFSGKSAPPFRVRVEWTDGSGVQALEDTV